VARKILLINLLLLMGVAGLSYHLVEAWEAFESQRNLAAILASAERQLGPAEEPAVTAAPPEVQLPDLSVISERDLFRPERRPPAEVPADTAVVEAPKFPKRPQMQGASEVNGERRALLTIYDTPKSPGDLRQVAKGDLVQGYTVTDITDTTVVLQWNDVREVIDMFDAEPGAPQPQVQAARKGVSVNIIRVGTKHAAVETSSSEEAQTERASQAGSPVPPAAAPARRVLPDRRSAQQRRGTPGSQETLIQSLVGVPRPVAPAETPTPAPENP
jgi:hypothetical protein